MTHSEKLARMYARAGINQFFRPAIHVGDGEAEIRMSARPDMYHAAGAVHGAAYFKMLDDAAFFAVQSLVPETFVLTSSFTVYLLAPVTDGEMVSRGRVIHRSKRLFTAEATLHVGAMLVAHGSGTFGRGTTRLQDVAGYG